MSWQCKRQPCSRTFQLDVLMNEYLEIMMFRIENPRFFFSSITAETSLHGSMFHIFQLVTRTIFRYEFIKLYTVSFICFFSYASFAIKIHVIRVQLLSIYDSLATAFLNSYMNHEHITFTFIYLKRSVQHMHVIS